MDPVAVSHIFSRRFRPARMRRFCEMFRVHEDTTVLDIGGTLFNWTLSPVRPRLNLLNRVPSDTELPPGVEWTVGDALELPFPDGHFDIAFSNSVIEHVGGWEEQRRFASEARRVARRYFVQTPNFWFPVEPHLMTPLVHWLPRPARRRLMPFTTWALMDRPTAERLERRLDGIHLLSRRRLRELFPDARILTERILGVPKSLIAAR